MSRFPLVLFAGLLLAAAFFLGRLTAPVAPSAAPGFSRRAAPSPLPREGDSATTGNPPPAAAAPSAPAHAALEALDRTAGSAQRDDERIRLLGEWAATDPLAALEYAKKNLTQDRLAQALTAVFSTWGRTAPAAAWAWVTTNVPGEMPHLDAVMGEIGKVDPALAARLAMAWAAQRPEAGQELLLAAVQGMSYAGRFTEAQQIIEALPLASEENRGALVNFLAGQWARYQPEVAAGWIATLPPGPGRDEALVNLGEAWSEVNPGQAAEFAISLPAGPTRQATLRQAVAKWLMADPQAARNWVIDSEHHKDFDEAVASIATDVKLMNLDTDHALLWAGAIWDGSLRLRSVGIVLANLEPRNPSAVLAYIQSSPDLTPDERTRLLQQFGPKN